jgi:hypothetical protein
MCKDCSSSRTTYYKKQEKHKVMLMTDEERLDLFEQAKGLSGNGKMELLRSITVAHVDEDFEEEDDAGEFKPLEVWAKLSYPTDRILQF